MALVFKPGKELILMEKKDYRRNWKKNKDKWDLESKEKVWNDRGKTWTKPASQTGYIGPKVRAVFLNLKDEVESTAIFLDTYKKERNCITQYEKKKLKRKAEITRRRARGRLC